MSHPKHTDDELRAIILPMWDADHSLEQVAEACGLANYRAIYRVAVRLGLGNKPRHPRAHGPKPVDCDREKLAALWTVMPLRKLAKHLGRAPGTISSIAAQMGLGPKPSAEAFFDEEPTGAALADLLYRIGETTELIADIAKDHRMGRRTAVQLAKRHGVVRGNGRRLAQRRMKYAAEKKKPTKGGEPLQSLFSVVPTDPDVKILMRHFVPVCRARVVDKKAPADAWVVGRMVMAEQEMRALAARKAA